MHETGWDIGFGDRRFNTALADIGRPLKQQDAVDQIRIEETLRSLGAAFHQQRRDAAGAERLQQFSQLARIRLQYLDARSIQGRPAPQEGGISVVIEGRRMSGNRDDRILPRRLYQLAAEGKLELLVDDDAQGRAIFEAGNPAGQFRIVSNRRADADEDGVAFGAQHLHIRPGGIAGDANLPLARFADHAIGGNGKLQSHVGTVPRLAHEVACQGSPALRLENAGIDFNAGVAQHIDAAPGNALVGIGDADDDARDAVGDQSLGAGWCLAVMRAGFERYIGRRAPRRFTGFGKRLRLGMWTTADSRDATANDHAILDDQAADRRIGGGQPQMRARQADCFRHETLVFRPLRHWSGVQRIAGDLRVDLVDDVLEILRMGEIAIDGRIAYEGDIIEALQRFQHLETDLFRTDLGFARAFEAADDAGHGSFDAVAIDRTLAQRDIERAHQLFAIEKHFAAGLLDDHQLAKLHAFERGEATAAIRADPPSADGGIILRRARILNLGIFRTAIGAAHAPSLAHIAVHREAVGELDHLLAHGSLDGSIAFVGIGDLQAVEHFDDQIADFPEVGFLEAARRAGRRAEADARRDEGLFRVERDAVLVAGDVGTAEGGLRTLAGGVLLAQVDQHQVVVGAAGDDVDAAGNQRFGQSLGVLDDLSGVILELRLQRFAESHGLGGDDVHQRTTLETGEDRRVELLGQILFIGEDHAAARAAQRLVRGGGGNVAMRERRRMLATGNEAGDVGHVDHQIGADAVGDLAEALPVPDTGIGRATGDDQLRLGFFGLALNLIHVEQVVAFAHAVGHDVEPLAGHVDRRTMRQVTARIQVETHESIARLQEREEDGLVHLRTGVRLNVGEVDAEQLLGALDGELFRDIDELAAAVIALARIAFSIFIRHDRALCFQHGARHDVFRSDQLDFVPLATQFLTDRSKDFRIGIGKRAVEEGFGGRICHRESS
ncbi:hypothetical protein RHSP_17832 [Rhizobium freirei PRF 81]|uniref:Uncharacterized protein n=1 Tax=Rhizobium freirei PRF 81 TaxID=363754 RepID=N6UVZ9_9HYPH|nr:hypothetical protein RHSP_17832 [Rhizobium freirei PRF 81]